jgi:hypothetical protein
MLKQKSRAGRPWYPGKFQDRTPSKILVPELEFIRPKVHAAMNAVRGAHWMSKKTKEVRKAAKKAKKTAKKARKDDDKVDTSSVPPKSPFST